MIKEKDLRRNAMALTTWSQEPSMVTSAIVSVRCESVGLAHTQGEGNEGEFVDILF